MRYFDAFSGIGGFSIGIERACAKKAQEERTADIPQDLSNPDREPRTLRGSEPTTCVGFSEIDKYASQVLKYKYPNTTNYGDISKINWSLVPDFDLLTGGSPCQDFSIAGKRAGVTGARSGLVWEFIRCLEEKKPQYFIWENVKGVMSSRSGWDFANILSAFSEAGYSLWWQVLNAKDFGVPQNRERIFVVGFRTGSPREVFFERSTDEQIGINIVAHKQGYRRNRQTFSPDGLVEALDTATGGGRGHHTCVAPTIRATEYKHGDNQTLVVEDFYPDRVRTFDHAPSLRSDRSGLKVANDMRIRRLIPTECMRLMSWDDDWCDYGINEKGEKVEISDTQKYKMAGNGVVSNCVQAIMENIIFKI